VYAILFNRFTVLLFPSMLVNSGVEFVCSCAAATHSCQIELVKTLGSFTSTSITR